ncbi:MAG: nuclear transport factor 2 family protein [Deltaproteobacteria bacterium]|nr:nuclear transport factor 2 family protein [Deltaproteobacteria bacterium]
MDKTSGKYSPTGKKDGSAAKSSLDLMSRYVTALQQKDIVKMNALRSADFVRDLVAGDAFLDNPAPNQDVSKFWSAWFAGFEDLDYEVTRTIASESIIVLEWTFTGTNTGLIDLEIFNRLVEPTGNTVCFRGASIYEIDHGLIKKETLYMDLATLWVELGVMT